ncbi:MAG: DEAD/DEAH box helicase, partial [Deltaproteobacteria bacterium]|nr:DEAD/DEAH box helicase [Deltaproteobacteria bacterium]
RLVCGDVGFGKTEVALRAAFKAATAGKQVALLVPTTILADQHYATFQARLRDFPIKVGCVSRFYPAADNKKTLEKVAKGEIDIIIGTHRLLQRDVGFRDLGLVIIDEEHRFGVADKERLKRVRREVHVLTLTATPIPRTLYMSLFDIRDLSVIETPPTDRQVIRTYLAPYQGSIVREAILRELGRGGQAFYIHNRVANIAMVADELRELIPEARIVFAHGQMKDEELEKVMHAFILHEADVLVSTTIVESGLDIPNANTIIIRNADKLGLAELYQLRGRVGRSSRRAYAYLLVSDSKNLGSEARQRLQVLQSLDDLGQGFRLALQDMEIRGAGNLLGKDQSGKIELVGFELYSRILKEAVRELRSKGQVETTADGHRLWETMVDPEINVGFPVYIPEHFVPDVEERLLLYQRLADIRSDGEGMELAEEIEDRFGHLPTDVSMLIELMVLRSVLRRVGITHATLRNSLLSLSFHRDVKLDPEKVLLRVQGSRGRLKISPSMVLTARLEDSEFETPRELTRTVRDILRSLGCEVDRSTKAA